MKAVDLFPGMVSVFGDTTETIISIVEVRLDDVNDHIFDNRQMYVITYLSSRSGLRSLRVGDNVKFWSIADLVHGSISSINYKLKV